MYLAICDDQAEELDVLINLLRSWQKERGTTLQYRTFRNATELLDSASKSQFTLYLLDIMMPGTDGMTAAREIRTFDDTANIVFLTSSSGFAYESYSVHALDYLLKPIQSDMLFPILDRLFLQEQRPQDGLTLKSGSTLIRVPFSHLTFVEIMNKHLYFHMTDGEIREVAGSLKEYENLLLSRPEFIRIGRSYIVNILQIQEFSPNGITTFSRKIVPIPRRLYPQLQKDYMKLLFNQRGR